MTLPPRFRKDTESAIATYNFVDIASGTGFVKWYIAETYDGSAGYILTTNTPYSNNITKSGNVTINYDTSVFQLPQTVRGVALLALSMGSSSAANITVTVRLKKWDGTTETNISPLITQAFTADTGAEMFLFNLDCTETLIKKGELLRLTITGDNVSAIWGQDPQGRDDGVIVASSNLTSASNIDIPFRIDL